MPQFIDQVFDAIARPAVALKLDALTGQAAVAGSTFSVPGKVAWLNYTMDIVVMDYERPYRIAYRLLTDSGSSKRKSPPIDAIYKLAAVPEGTRVRFTQRNNARDPIGFVLTLLLWPLALFKACREAKRLRERIEAEIAR
jgi:hypothetical protein